MSIHVNSFYMMDIFDLIRFLNLNIKNIYNFSEFNFLNKKVCIDKKKTIYFSDTNIKIMKI